MATTPKTPTTTTTTPPSTPIILNFDSLNESWCELKFKSGCSSTGSISHNLNHSVNPEILEKLLHEAQKEASLLPLIQEAKPEPMSKKNSYTSMSDGDKSKISRSVEMSYLSLSSNGSTMTVIDADQSLALAAKSEVEEANKCCLSCLEHQKQIDDLLDKQNDQALHILQLKRDYAEKMMCRTPELSVSSFSQAMSSSQVSGDTLTLAQQAALTSQDWMKYWSTPSEKAVDEALRLAETIGSHSSRPQIQPPKEWNFIHPNSSKSKYNKIATENKTYIDSALNSNSSSGIISKLEKIGKIIFTQMASFIVGATLMYLFLRRQINIKSSVCYI